MKKIKYIVLVFVVIAGTFLYAHIAKNNIIYDKELDNSEYLPTGIVHDGEIRQEFTSVEETMDGVRVKSQLIGDVQGIQVEYSLIDNTSGEKVFEGKVNAEEIESNKFYLFPFEQVTNCKGKTYTIVLKNLNGAEDKGVGFFFQPYTEQGTELEISGNDTEGTLILKQVTNRFDLETFVILLVFIIYIYLFIKFLYRLFK